jgi:hypothetical protein
MHEGGALTWREVVDQHHSALVDEISIRLDSEVRHAVARAVAAALAEAGVEAATELKRACEEARRSQVDSLNQFLRRLRAAGEERVLDLLAEGCASYAGKLVVLVFESNQARSAAGVGLQERGIARLSFDIQSAPAVVAAIDSRDPMVALATEAEISPVLAQAFGIASSPDADQKAYLFPVVARQSVVAMLVASEVGVCAPIELFCEAAGLRFETGAAAPAPGTSGPRGWDDLSVEERKLHLQAQRTARVRVAEMRLYHENELRDGAARGDIYGALRNEIDAARDQFLHMYLAKSAAMVDYLHLEILRSLAHDDDRLLGHNYPGPMV